MATGHGRILVSNCGEEVTCTSGRHLWNLRTCAQVDACGVLVGAYYARLEGFGLCPALIALCEVGSRPALA